MIWNRFRWVRAASDSSKRRMVENPRAAWIVQHHERLRIVPEDLWLAVKHRQAKQAAVIGERVRRGLSQVSAKSTGPGSKYLLSGLLRCATCGSSLVVSGGGHRGAYYACSSRVHGGASACANGVRVPRARVEDLLLADLRQSLRNPAVIKDACARVRKRLARPKPPAVTPVQVRTVEPEIANLTDAVAAGLLKSSPALAERLHAAEAELARLRGESRPTAAQSIA